MKRSQSWRDFLVQLREIAQLLRADPQSRYAERKLGLRTQNVELTSALTKACMSLTSGRLQGCLVSQTQEFLENLDQSGVTVETIPEVLRAHLAIQFPGPRGKGAAVRRTIAVQRAYAPLWISGTILQPGTIRTSCLPDKVWNPWPDKAHELLCRCDINLYDEIEQEHGPVYLSDLKTYVGGLVEFRNKVAHGDEPQSVSLNDVRLSMKWAIRLGRACDEALGRKLAALTGNPAWP